MLTKEREEEVRESLVLHHKCIFIDDQNYLDHADDLEVLLAEIDQLRADIKVHERNEKDLEKAANGWMKQYDAMVDKYEPKFATVDDL